MIIYLDTSAVVPLLIREPSSTLCQQAWQASDDAVTSRLTYVEGAAALAQAWRNGRMDTDQHGSSLAVLDAVWAQCDVIDLDQDLAVDAAAMARRFGLRGYDAVHCASAARIRDDTLVAVSGDRKLLQAWSNLGLATLDVHSDASQTSP